MISEPDTDHANSMVVDGLKAKKLVRVLKENVSLGKHQNILVKEPVPSPGPGS